jgi:hypothetical protein
MRRIWLAGIVCALGLAIVPAAAQASLVWEVKGPPAVFEELTKGTKETLKTQAGFTLNGKNSGKVVKGKCGFKDEETIENPIGGFEGVDEMTSFAGACEFAKALPIKPCVIGETANVRGVAFPWLSELVPTKNDLFEGVELEVECNPSKATLKYKPAGGIWNMPLAVNALKSTPASALFKFSPGNNFTFSGTDTLTPALHTEVR